MSCDGIKALIITLCFFPFPAYAEMYDKTLLPRAEAGDAVAQLELVKNYTHGYSGAEKDDAEAIKWLNVIIQNKNCSSICDRAYVELGRRYELGEGVAQDYKKAIEYYKIASSKNFRMGRRLAHLYAEGKGADQSYAEAYYWISTVVGINETSENNDFKNKLRVLVPSAKVKEIDASIAKEREVFMQQGTQRDPLLSLIANVNPDSMSTADKNGLELFKLTIYPIKSDNISLAKKYIDAGAKLNLKDNKGVTTLIAAAKGGNVDFVNLLINAGADTNESSSNGMSPLAWAVASDQVNVVDILLKHKANPQQTDAVGNFPLLAAAEKGNLQIVKLLVSNGADINFHGADNTEYTPLIAAAIAGKAEAVQYLISLGADVNIAMDRDKYGSGDANADALFFARKYNHQKVVDVLQAAGAK